MQEFCGKDDMCHSFSCENWYLYGNEQYTTYKNQDQPALVCSDIDVDDDNDYKYLGKAGIYHGCSVTIGLHQSFTQECFAQLDNYTNFTCHEMSSGSDYSPFIEKINSTNITCEGAKDPAYLYVNWMGYDTKFGDSSIVSAVGSQTFNETKASKTIYSALVSGEVFNSKVNNTGDDDDDDPNGSFTIDLRMSNFVWTSILLIAFTVF